MKRIAALVISITLVLFAAGCSKSNDNKSAAATHKGTMDISQAASSDTTVVYGRVDSIVGNEVTLALGKPQQGSGMATASSADEQQDAQSEGQKSTDGTGNAGGERASGNMGERPSGNATGEMPSGGPPSGEMPAGGPPSGEMPSGNPPSGEKQQESATGTAKQGGRSVTLDYTGETATYLLPVGMAIGTGDFSDVTEGMVLSLTLNADSTITAVTILSR